MCSLALQTRSKEGPRTSRRELRLNAVIAEYLQALEAGCAPDRGEFLERHRDLTDGLNSFFRDEDQLKRFAGLPRAAP